MHQLDVTKARADGPEAEYRINYSQRRKLAAGERRGYSAAMESARPVIALLAVLIALEGVLFGVGSAAPLSTIKDGVLLGFLFGFPTLLVGGLIMIRQPWTVMGAVIYSTIALALDLATIVQEASQGSPRVLILILTVVSSLLNFLIMIFGGRCVLTFQPGERPPGGPHPNLQFPSSS